MWTWPSLEWRRLSKISSAVCGCELWAVYDVCQLSVYATATRLSVAVSGDDNESPHTGPQSDDSRLVWAAVVVRCTDYTWFKLVVVGVHGGRQAALCLIFIDFRNVSIAVSLSLSTWLCINVCSDHRFDHLDDLARTNWRQSCVRNCPLQSARRYRFGLKIYNWGFSRDMLRISNFVFFYLFLCYHFCPSVHPSRMRVVVLKGLNMDKMIFSRCL